MYKIARLLLVVGTVSMLYCCLAIVPVTLPWSIFGFAAAVYWWLRWNRGQLTTLGSARWANEIDLTNAGMLHASFGLILGRAAVNSNFALRLRALFSSRLTAEQACDEFCSSVRDRSRAVVCLPNAIHTAVFSPSGGGKGVSCVVPFLLTCDQSCVVVDFKGENAKLTAEHRRKAFGHKIILLDPFHVVSQQSDHFNPLDFLKKDNPLVLDECADLANAMVIRTGNEHEPHWNDSAEAWVKGALAMTVHYGIDGARSLQTVRDVFSGPERVDTAVKIMRESDAWKGMLRRIGAQLELFVDREKGSVLTSVCRHLRFLDTLAISENTQSSTFDPAELRNGRMTIYMVLPPEHMRTQSPLLRMWISAFLRSVVRGGLHQRNKVHVILDEAASLGHMDVLEDAVDKYRAYNIRLQFYYQSLGQLKKCWPNGQDQTLLSNTTQVFFGVNDPATADYVSNRLGESTIVVESGGSGSGTSWQRGGGHCGQDSGSLSSNDNSNWQLQTRKLLKPEEVMALPPRTAITFTASVPPIATTLLRYYEEKNLGKPLGFFRRLEKQCRIFAIALLVGGFWLASAAILTTTLSDKLQIPTAISMPDQLEREESNTNSRTFRPVKGRFQKAR